MKKDKQITELVCAPHCRFYRPGEKEEMACRGYEFFVEVLEDVIAAEAARTAVRAISKEASPPEPFDHDSRIEKILCARCEFRAKDCDFMSGEEMPEAVPCGGYVLLEKLLAAGLKEAEDWINERP